MKLFKKMLKNVTIAQVILSYHMILNIPVYHVKKNVIKRKNELTRNQRKITNSINRLNYAQNEKLRICKAV